MGLLSEDDGDTTGLLGRFLNGVDRWKGLLGAAALDYMRNPTQAAATSADYAKQMIKEMGQNPAQTALQAGSAFAPTVYHGSPHVFDKFDAGKIGAGEGNQAFGHGLYFAENPGVAAGYRNALGRSEMRDASGTLLVSGAQPPPCFPIGWPGM